MLKLIANGKDNAQIAARAPHQPEDGQEPHLEHPDEAADREPHPGGGLRGPQRDRLGDAAWCGAPASRTSRRRARGSRRRGAGRACRAARVSSSARARSSEPGRAPAPSAPGRPVELGRQLRHPPLEPELLRLERERARVAVGQRRLELRRGRPVVLGCRRLGEQLVDLVVESWNRVVCHRASRRLFAGSGDSSWAARPIWPRGQAHRLTPGRSLRTMAAGAGAAVSSLVLAAAFVLAAPAGAGHLAAGEAARGGARASRTSPGARTAALAFDLKTGHDGLRAGTTRSRSRRPRTRSSRSRTRRSSSSGPTFRIETDVARHAASRTARPGTAASAEAATATRRSRAERPGRARRAGARGRASCASPAPSSATSRSSTRAGRRPAGSRGSTSTSRRRSRRSPSTARVYRGRDVRATRRWRRRSRSATRCARAGVTVVGGTGHRGRPRRPSCPLASVESAAARVDPALRWTARATTSPPSCC